MQKRQKQIALLFSLLLVGITIATLRSQAQDGSASAGREKVLPLQATTTEKQRKHSKLFKHQGPKLRELAAGGTEDISVEVERPYLISTPSNQSTPLPYMQAVVCNADAIVVGMLKNESPQLTENENFIFTEYDFVVEEAVKTPPGAAIQPNSTITVTRDGGTAQVNARIVRAKVAGFDSFKTDKRYVLFLRFLPETGDYLAYANGSFLLNEKKVVPFGEMPESESKDSMAFLDLVRIHARATNCGQVNDKR
jgi:hypothetical protein